MTLLLTVANLLRCQRYSCLMTRELLPGNESVIANSGLFVSASSLHAIMRSLMAKGFGKRIDALSEMLMKLHAATSALSPRIFAG